MVDIVLRKAIFVGVLSFCFNAYDLSVNLTCDKIFQSDYLDSL